MTSEAGIRALPCCLSGQVSVLRVYNLEGGVGVEEGARKFPGGGARELQELPLPPRKEKL